MTAGRRARNAVRATAAVAVLAVLATATVWLLDRYGSEGRAEAPRRLALGLPLNPAELDQAGLTRALDLAQRAGVSELSTGAAWWYVSRGRSPDAYDWSALDRLVEAAAARRMRVRLQLTGTPDAVHPDVVAAVPDPRHRIWYPPRTPQQLQQWSRFVSAAVTHFRGRVASFEMWNEPNIAEFWAPAPDAGEYARLLAAAYRSAKRAWPDADVVFGGLSRNDVGYLQRYYSEARRLFPDAAANRFFFDTLDVHPYTDDRSPDETSPRDLTDTVYGTVDTSFPGLRRMKAAMDHNEGDDSDRDDGDDSGNDDGDRAAGGKDILVGEYGFSTRPTPSAPAVPDRRRAYFLTRAVAQARGMPFVSSLTWYGFLPDSTTDPGWAIVTAEGRPTWTYRALADLAAGGGGLTPARAGPSPAWPPPARRRRSGTACRSPG